jgi:uncharacterized OsmC-like protein
MEGAVSTSVKVTTVRSASIGQPGRALNTARMHAFVLDSSSGPGEGLTNTEAFLAGIASCGVTLIERHAGETGVGVPNMAVTISGLQSAADPARFQAIEVRFEFRGVDRAEADRLVDVWRRR